MDPDLVRPLLRALRQLRGGSLDLDALDPAIRSVLGGSLAGACRALVLWADTEVADPKAADAFLRAYGLGRMPETRAGIGLSLRSASGRLGISPAAVDDLLRTTEQRLAERVAQLPIPNPWGRPTPGVWADPFAGAASSPRVRRQLQQVLWGAWADVPDQPVHDCVAALLLYEQEHGLRAGPPPARHREHRRRLRRLAWSMLTVARERHVAKQPDDILVDLLLGPRRIAVVEHLPPEAVALLVGLDAQGSDRVGQVLEYIRSAVRHGRAEAPELIGLLRESIARGVRPLEPEAVTAGVAALTTIVSREQRQVTGVLASAEAIVLASEAGERLARLPALDTPQRRQATATLHYGLRAAQEAAELHDVLGYPGAAWRAVRQMGRLLGHLDPADQAEVNSWGQQHLQTRSTLARHVAPSSRHTGMWLQQADRDANRSLHLANSEGLAPGYRLVPTSQLLAIVLARMRHSGGGDLGARARLEERARRHLAEAMIASRAVGDAPDRPTSSARLSVARRWWELALLCGDPAEVGDARTAALALVRPCTLDQDLEKLERLEAASRLQGITPAGPRRRREGGDGAGHRLPHARTS